MIFQGDVSKYHPADALMFLSQLSLNGLLTIACGDQIVTLTFNSGHLVDAHSKRGDEKLLQVLRFNKALTAPQDAQIRKIRSETGMPVRQLLTELGLFSLQDVRKWLSISIDEVLLELFLMERGQFHFTDTPVETDGVGIEHDAAAIAIRVLSHAEELRSFEKSIVTLDRGLVLKASKEQLAVLPPEERTVVYIAARATSVRQLMATAPYYSHKTMQIIERYVGAKIIELAPVCMPQGGAKSAAPPSVDSLFGMFKQTFKLLMHTDETLKKVEAMIGFCKEFFDGILILTAKENQVIHCKAISIEKDQSIHQRTLKGEMGLIDQDPVFQTVHKTGVGFFGKVFPSPIIRRMVQLPAEGECALFPIINQRQLAIYFYAFSRVTQEGLSPHHYLELLSWLAMPIEKTKPTASAEASPGHPDSDSSGAAVGMPQLVAKIDELPPLPAMASRALELLSDPEASAETVERSIALDQALVAKMIRVSNSVLYGGLQKVESLRQALTRLGAKTTKSLILAASTRSYFFKEHKGMKVWGPLLWQHSVECGMASRRIAATCGFPDPEQAYIGGIMHDIGKLAILMIDDKKYQEINRIKVTEKHGDLSAESRIVGASHTELGRMLMEKWRMPDAVKACAEYHHQPETAGDLKTLVAIVSYADLLSHIWGSHPQAGLAVDDPRLHQLMHTIGISPEQNSTLLIQVQADFQNADLLE